MRFLFITILLTHGIFGDDCPSGFTSSNGACLFKCNSDLNFDRVVVNAQKGIAVDDTTFDNCINKLPYVWPNTDTTVKSLRLFSAWKTSWGDIDRRNQAWDELKKWVVANNAKILLGAQVSCFESSDDVDWENAKGLLQLLGREHIMGLAIGNELELLHLKDPKFLTADCLDRLWRQRRYLDTTFSRITELDAMPGFAGLPITAVFGGFAFAGDPFHESPKAMINTYLSEVWMRYGERFRFSWNFYPYFNANLQNDGFMWGFLPTCPSTTDCESAVRFVTDYGAKGDIASILKVASRKMAKLTGISNAKMWIGEMGWSAPKSDTLNSAMADCERFSSLSTLQSYYTGFLEWDLGVDGIEPPEHAFYFTHRDSFNFEVEEHFGLIGTCNDTQCKLNSSSHIFKPSSVCSFGERAFYITVYVSLFCLCGCWVIAACAWMVYACRKAKEDRERDLVEDLDEEDDDDDGDDDDEE